MRTNIWICRDAHSDEGGPRGEHRAFTRQPFLDLDSGRWVGESVPFTSVRIPENVHLGLSPGGSLPVVAEVRE